MGQRLGCGVSHEHGLFKVIQVGDPNLLHQTTAHDCHFVHQTAAAGDGARQSSSSSPSSSSRSSSSGRDNGEITAPAMAAAAPTSIPSFHHSHHRHACPIPHRPLATRGHPFVFFFLKIRWEHPWISMVDVWPVGFVGGLPKP